MFRNIKMRTVIIIVVAFSVAIGLCLLCILAANNSNAMLEDKINDNMSTYLNAQEKAIEKFVEDSEEKLMLFSKAKYIEDLLVEDQNDLDTNPNRIPENENLDYFSSTLKSFNDAQNYTLSYYSSLKNWEGLYVANMKTTVLTYNATPVIGRTLRTGDSYNALIASLEANKNGIYNDGITISKGSGQLCLSMFVPVVKDNKMIGYVGAGVFYEDLRSILAANTITGIEDKDFYMINYANGLLFAATDIKEEDKETLLGQETDNPVLIEVMKRIKDGKEVDHFEFQKDDYKDGATIVVNYEAVSGRDWAVILTANKDGLYDASNSNIRNMVIIGSISFILILILVAIAITLLTNPLVKVTDAIKELGKFNLRKNNEVINRANDQNEVGEISHEIEELRASLNEMVSTIKECSTSIGYSANNMSINSDSLTSYVTENNATTQQLAASLSSTVDIVDNVNSHIKRMNSLVENVVNSVNESSEKSTNILSTAETMEKKSSQTLADSKQNITNNKNAIQEVITKLRELSKINTFVDDILSISSQTKLLSLNASIEAARAGEHGKGFSVVATEIGTLASNTATAAQKIQDITRLTNESIEETVKCFNELNEYLENDIMSKFEEFNSETQTNNHITSELITNINEISKNITEFKNFVNTLVEQMNEIKRLSVQNNSGIDDIVDKNENTNNIAENMADAVSINKNNAKALSEIIEKFTI